MSPPMLKHVQFSTIYWLVGRIIQQLGALGLLGVSMVIASVLLFGLKITSANEALVIAEQHLNKKTIEAEQPSSQQKIAQKKPEDFDFYSVFPNTSDLSTTLQTFKSTASKNRLALNQGNYKFTLISKNETKLQDIVKYEIKLPLTGSYIEIRTFVNEILLQLPTLALSDVQLTRDSSISPTIDANLTFIFFARSI